MARSTNQTGIKDKRTLLVVDASVEDKSILLADLPASVDVLVLDPTDLSGVARKIGAHGPVDTLHILTHGEPGALSLGGNRVDAAQLEAGQPFAEALTGLLSAGSKLALWACSVAAQSAGAAFTNALESLTGATVFASAQPVGATVGGGTWNIGTVAPFSDRSMALYGHTLPAANEDFDSITAQIVSNTDHFNNDSTTDWVFFQATDAQIAIAGNANGGTFTNGLSNDGAGDRVIFLNYNGLTSGNTSFTIEQSDGDHFQLVSFELGNNLAGYSTSVTITLLRDSGTIGSAVIDLNTSSTSDGITYTYGGDSSGGSARPFGTLTFNSDYANVDQIELVYSSAATPIIDNIVVGTPANLAPTIDTAPSDITVAENTESDVDLSLLDLTDSENDDLTVTFTVDSGTFTTLADGAADGVIETLVDGQTITLVGTSDEIESYLNTASNIQYTGAANVSGNNVATLSVDVDDGTSNATDTINIDITNVNTAPSNLWLDNRKVVENDEGAIIGHLDVTDADDTKHTLTVSDDRFTFTDDGYLKLKDGVSIDYELEPTVTVSITATDRGGKSRTEEYTIRVIDLNEVLGSNGPDTIDGTDEDDFVSASGGHDVISTGNGQDTVIGGDGEDTISGGNDDDLLRGGDGNDRVQGDDGSDTLGGGAGDDYIDGGVGNDVIWGRSGDDTIDGGSGDDVLYNGEGNDTVDGGTGDDTLWAGSGDDMLTGGDGADTFIFGATSGNDTVSDFDTAQDTLDLQYSGAGFSALADVQAAASDTTQNGQDGLLIDLGNGQSVFLIGLDTGDLASMTIDL